MKKILFIAAVATVVFGSCNKNSIPKGAPKTNLDTLTNSIYVFQSHECLVDIRCQTK